MEDHDKILKAVIGRPKLTADVSDPFPIIGKKVTIKAHSKWVFEHTYTLDDGVDTTSNSKPSVLGESEAEVEPGVAKDLLQHISVRNVSGNKDVTKYLYAMNRQAEPYYDVFVSKEIIRNDGETTSIILTSKNGYMFSDATVVDVKIYPENNREDPAFSLFGQDFTIEALDEFSNRLVSNEISLEKRGIYDIISTVTENDVAREKMIGKIITVTPRLGSREDAWKVVLRDDGSTILDGGDYPGGGTIIISKDPAKGDYTARLRLNNFHGTWDKPYIITIDQEDPLVIKWNSWWGLSTGNSEHIVFDGRGYHNLSKGIQLVFVDNGNTAIGCYEGSSETEFFEILINGASFAGIVHKTDPSPDNPKYWYDNFKENRLLIHHVEICNTNGEGVYLGYYGTEWIEKANNAGTIVKYRAHHMYNGRLYRCYFHDNGYDNVQWNNAEDTEICYNTLVRGGQKGDYDQSTCFSVSLKNSKIYNNIIYGTKGLFMQFAPLGELRIYNNIMTNPTPGTSGMFLLASVNTPELNPDEQGWNDNPVYIHNNMMVCDASMAMGGRNTAQCRGVRFYDNLFVINGNTLAGGQRTDTVNIWLQNSRGNILLNKIGLTDEQKFDLIDKTYKIGDSSNNDMRISSNSILAKSGCGEFFEYDIAGYKQWYASTFPVGAYQGIFRDSSIDETFRITSFVINNGDESTTNTEVEVTWQYYGSLPIIQYRLSENIDGEGWTNYEEGAPIHYQLSSSKGEKHLFLQLKNSGGEISDIASTSIVLQGKMWKIGINGTANNNASGVFNQNAGIINFRMDGVIASDRIFPLKNTLGESAGSISRGEKSKNYPFGAEGIASGDNSGIYPDDNMKRCLTTTFGNTMMGDDILEFNVSLSPGTYRVGIYGNSNSVLSDELADLYASYLIYTVNGVEKCAIRIKNNVDNIVWFEDVKTENGALTIMARWDEKVMSLMKPGKTVCGPINVIQIEEN